jgi:hypothetical protein
MNILNESLNLYNPPIDKIAHYWENRKKKILKDMIRDIAGKILMRYEIQTEEKSEN